MGGVGKPPRTSNTANHDKRFKAASRPRTEYYNFGYDGINHESVYPSITGHPAIERRLTFVGSTLGVVEGALLGAEVGPEDGDLEGTCRW